MSLSRLRRIRLALALVAGIAAASGLGLPAAGQPAVRAEMVVGGLEVPWAVAFAPDGRIFISERPGRIRVVRGGRLEPEPWATLKVWQAPPGANEAGLLGLALDPDFARNHFVYVYHTYRAGGEEWNRVVRMFDRDGRGTVDRVTLDRIPAAAVHDGGRILFGPDGHLYVGTGDARQDELAQSRSSLAGKILRITRDGGIPGDNPFPGSPVYSLGHRNVQGLGWHPVTRRLYATEHGPSGAVGVPGRCCRDELNLIEPGRNYGWPVVTGSPGDPRFVDPLAHSGDQEVWAPGGLTFVTRGPWAGSLVFAGLRGEALYRVAFEEPEGRRVARIEPQLRRQFGRLRDVVEGPDGVLYVATSNRDGRGSVRSNDDKLLRLVIGP